MKHYFVTQILPKAAILKSHANAPRQADHTVNSCDQTCPTSHLIVFNNTAIDETILYNSDLSQISHSENLTKMLLGKQIIPSITVDKLTSGWPSRIIVGTLDS